MSPWMASRMGLVHLSLVSWMRSQVEFSRRAGQWSIRCSSVSGSSLHIGQMSSSVKWRRLSRGFVASWLWLKSHTISPSRPLIFATHFQIDSQSSSGLAISVRPC